MIKYIQKYYTINETKIKINVYWDKKYPSVFKNVRYSKLIESKGILEAYENSPESLQILRGKITNEFGIRDDILEYILSLNLSESNNYAIVKFSQIATIIYFQAKNKTEATSYSQILVQSLFCFKSNNWLKISQKIDSMMRDTKERNKRMWWVDNHYFAYQALGTGLSGVEEGEICEKGNY